jgi:hypothetical protein
MTKLPKNPFQENEDWQSWLENDNFYLQSKKQSFQKYIYSFPIKNNFFMSIQEKYLQTVHFITKNAVLATVIMIIAITTVGAVAAELVAPQEFKPSNLFRKENTNGTNTQNFYKTDLKTDKYDISVLYFKDEMRLTYGGNLQNNDRCNYVSLEEMNKENDNFILNFEVKKQLDNTKCQAQISPLQVSGEAKIELNSNQLTDFNKIFTINLNGLEIGSQSSSSNQIQPLKADENYDVAVIDDCDLAVRFPKQLKARKDVDASNPNNSTVIVLEDPNKLNGKLKPSSIYNLECGNKKYEIIQAEATNDKNFADESGLDLSKVLELQRYIQPPLGGIDINKGVFKAGSVTTFTKNNVDQFLYYSLSQSGFYQSENSFPAIQIQFNSLAPSTPSVSLEGGEKQNTQTQSFTDQIYPDLNIKYDNSWKLATKNSLVSTDATSDYYGGLENKEITLTKNETVLKFDLSIARQTGCGGGPDLTPVATAGRHYRYINDTAPNKYVYQSYSKGILCSLDYNIISNLSSKNYPKYSNQDEPFVKSFVAVSLTGNNQQELTEADQIIANSSFSTTDSSKKSKDKNDTNSSSQPQTYTNEFYPDLNIKYDNSWIMKTETYPSQYNGILSRSITLSKNGTEVTFNISPKFTALDTCITDAPAPIPSISPVGKYHRYSAYQFIYWYQSYSLGNKCPNDFILKSTLLSKNYKNAGYEYDEQFVESMVSVEVLHATNPERLSEAEEIIKNSVFSSNRK